MLEISFMSLSIVSGKEFFDTNAQVKSHTSPDDTVTTSTYKVSPGDVCYTKIKINTNLEGLSKQISEEREERNLCKLMPSLKLVLGLSSLHFAYSSSARRSFRQSHLSLKQ